MPQEHFNHIGMRRVWGGEQPFGLCSADRRQHAYLIGQTGSGKTTLLRNMILQDIQAGAGVGVIDPHGDLAQELLNYIPSGRVEDVVYFRPTDSDWPVCFNLLRMGEGRHRHLAASGLVGAFKSIWRDSWGPRLEYILYAAVAALLECPNSSLLGVQRMLADASYRHWVVRQVSDPVVCSFWSEEFEGYDPRFRREAVAPIQNKVGQLLMSPPLRNILGQVKNRIDPRRIMDRGGIFIANLSKGLLGAEQANLLGAVLVTQFQLAAIARADAAEAERRDFFLFVDEFHNFCTDSFASILSELRKYRLCLTLAHQYLNQIPESIQSAVLGNIGSLIAFRVGEKDAAVLARQYGGDYTAGQFSELENYQVCAKLLSGGAHSEPFCGRTLAPVGRFVGRSEQIIRRCRQRLSRPRQEVEAKIRRWLGQKELS